MKKLLLLSLLLTSLAGFSKYRFYDSGLEFVIQESEEKAKPIRGFGTFYKTWKRHVSYTREARRYSIQGRVLIKFIVNEDGSLSNFQVEKGLGFGLDQMAISGIKQCGGWKPKRVNGKAVKDEVVLPFTFILN